jgi:hypothetical protein
MAWEELENPPKWITDAAREARDKVVKGNGDQSLFGSHRIYHGDTYVYKVEFGLKNHGHDHGYYRQLKSDYFETTSEEGTCPNCQAYVRRMDGDTYLTCHRCGWQYKSLRKRLKAILTF